MSAYSIYCVMQPCMEMIRRETQMSRWNMVCCLFFCQQLSVASNLINTRSSCTQLWYTASFFIFYFLAPAIQYVIIMSVELIRGKKGCNYTVGILLNKFYFFFPNFYFISSDINCSKTCRHTVWHTPTTHSTNTCAWKQQKKSCWNSL